MACGDFSTYVEFIRQDQFWDALYCPFADQVGAPVFALFVFGSVGVSLYVSSGGRVEVPLVVMILVGAAIAPFAPTFVISAAVVLFLVVLPAAGLLIIRRLKAGV